jgi:hypothetical protein
MRASLVSREVIADSVELAIHTERLDAMVLLAGCDKSLPGLLMAAARLGLPAVFLYGGSILPGRLENGSQVTIQLAGLAHHSDGGVQGGFNRSSQHPDETGCVDGTASGLDDDIDGATGDAVAGPTSDPSRCGAGLLGRDCRRADQRGSGARMRGVGPGRVAVVSRARRHAWDRSHSVVGQVSVIRRARGDRPVARAACGCPGDRPAPGAVTVDDLA